MSTVTIYPSSDYSIGCSGYPSNPARYSYIDESSPATTDYNFKYGVSTGQDLFGMSAHGQSTGVISNLAFSVYYTTQGNPGSCQLKVRIAANGTVYNFGSALGAVSNFKTGTVNLTTNPYTGAAWTWSDITNAKFGYYLTASTSGKYVIVAQMQITITYTLPPPTPSEVTASDGTYGNKVALSWSSGGADGPTTGYHIYRSGAYITSIAGTTYDDTGAAAPVINNGTMSATTNDSAKIRATMSGASVSNGTQYSYQVIAYGPGGNSAASPVTGPAYGYRGASALYYQFKGWTGSEWVNVGSNTTTNYVDDTSAAAPTITPGSTVASDGTSTAHVALSLSGTESVKGTDKIYSCYLTSAYASAVHSGTATGNRAAGSLSYQWQRSAAASDASYSNISGATSSTHNDTGAPAPTITPGSATATNGNFTDKIELTNPGISNNNGEVRYYKCYLTAASATAQYSSSDSGYRSAGTSACQWQMSAENTDANYSNISGATTVNYTYISGPNDSRYFRLYITASPASAVTSTPAVGRRSNGLYLFHG